MNTPSVDRRRFCQLAATGLGGLLLPRFALSAEPKKPKYEQPPEVYGEPLPFVPGSYTIAVLPDTQHYSLSYPQHYYNQTAWIADNAQKHNIKCVLHLGDITHRNTTPEWDVAQKAMKQLDGKVPYAMVTGNHDFLNIEKVAENRFNPYFNQYFPSAEYKSRDHFGGACDEGSMDNTFHVFRGGEQDYLVLALEWAPRDQVIDWANKIVAAHPKHRAILITHAYMYHDDTRYHWKKYGNKQSWSPHGTWLREYPGGANDGEDLWKKLVSKHPNFLMTLNGHVLYDGLARLTSRGEGGNSVHQMLVNYQMKEEGGQSALRLIEFLPDDETLQVKSYLPSLDKWKVDEQNQFVLKRTA